MTNELDYWIAQISKEIVKVFAANKNTHLFYVLPLELSMGFAIGLQQYFEDLNFKSDLQVHYHYSESNGVNTSKPIGFALLIDWK